MIIGSGLLARAFAPDFEKSQTECIYAAGVSNSSCTDQREFFREEVRLSAAVEQHLQAKLFLYFGTCSANGSLAITSPYVMHKIRMEAIVATHPRSLILRLPQIAGPTQNPHTLLNYIYNRISKSERFHVWRYARRNIIDVDDVARIGACLAADETMLGHVVDIANTSDSPVPHIVELMAKVIEKEPIYECLDFGDEQTVDHQQVLDVATRCGVVFGTEYLERVFRKYYGRNAHR